MESLTFRSADGSRWGAGLGADLSAGQVDTNFWAVFLAVNALEDATQTNAGIDFMQLVGGNQLFVHLTDHRVLGPFVIPATVWNPRGSWLPATDYLPLDVLANNGSLYIVNIAHTSASTFSPNATDGLSHDLYTLLLEEPANMLPAGGTIGQRLAKASGSPFATNWVSDRIRLCPQIIGQPDANEVVMQFLVVDHMTLPLGLAGSVAFAATAASAPASFTLEQGNAFIGTITFNPTGNPVPSFPADINCVPGDVITMIAPSVQDASLSNISFSLVGLLTE